LSLETRGREWERVTPRSASSAETGLEVIEVPRSACTVCGATPLRSMASAMKSAARTESSTGQMALLHYRVVDVSSIKELVRRWYPRVFFNAPAKTGGHRAMGDIEDSIQELRYYRETVFSPLPGPNSDVAKAAAADVTDHAPPPHGH
jgi:oligoribonuclease